jgi:TolB protein
MSLISTFPAMRLLRLLLILVLAVHALAARAQLSIEITGAGTNRIPVAVSPLEGESGLPQAISPVVRADLERSGLFRIVEAGAALGEDAAVNYADWTGRGADALAVGTVAAASGGRYEVRFRIYDTVKQVQLGGMAFVFAPSQYRTAAHRIADAIYEKLTGERGIFSTRIAYVVKSGGRFELQIADADGMNAQTALASREPIISPAWSPDGTRLAYVSFEAKKPIVYVHSLATGQRHVVANFKGSNSAPAWFPDGSQLAVVLTKDGSSQVYMVRADGSGVRRLSESGAIDTEPFFSPDGRHIYFTSDRGGSPQIYRIPANGGAAERITFDGSYNVTPRISPDGKTLAYVSRSNGRFQVTTMDLASRQTQVLTDSSRDESPSFAPNGRMIIYASEVGGRGVLAAISSDGRVKQRLSVQSGDVREPSWAPFIKN